MHELEMATSLSIRVAFPKLSAWRGAIVDSVLGYCVSFRFIKPRFLHVYIMQDLRYCEGCAPDPPLLSRKLNT